MTVPMSPGDPYLSDERVAARADLAARWVAHMKAQLRGETGPYPTAPDAGDPTHPTGPTPEGDHQ